jgi:DNA polymerase-3 subunit alpha
VNEFVHLHVHSNLSFQDALNSPEQLAEQAAALGMRAMALTEHGNLVSAPRWSRACQKHGIKPIHGCEFYMVPDMEHRNRDTERDSRRHLTVLAKNETGWKNLIRLSTESNLRGFYFMGRIDEKTLFDHYEGLIVLSGCQSSKLSRLLQVNDLENAQKTAEAYREVFDDDYYLEIVALDRDKAREAIVLGLQSLSDKLDIPLVITGDVHYISSDDTMIHYYLTKAAPKTGDWGYKCEEIWLKNGEQIWNTFVRHWKGTKVEKHNILQGMERSVEIAEKIEVIDIDPHADISQIPVHSDFCKVL